MDLDTFVFEKNMEALWNSRTQDKGDVAREAMHIEPVVQMDAMHIEPVVQMEAPQSAYGGFDASDPRDGFDNPIISFDDLMFG